MPRGYRSCAARSARRRARASDRRPVKMGGGAPYSHQFPWRLRHPRRVKTSVEGLSSHQFPWRLRHRRRVKTSVEGLCFPQTVASTSTFRSAEAARRRGHSRKRPKPLTGLPTIPLEVPSAVPPTAYARTAPMPWAATARTVFCSRGRRKTGPRPTEDRAAADGRPGRGRRNRAGRCARRRVRASDSRPVKALG